MSKKNIYFILTILGLLLPYSLFLPWLLKHGLDFSLFFHELFFNAIGGAFGLDVIVSSIVLIFFIVKKQLRNRCILQTAK